MIQHLKVGFIGAGNMTQVLAKGLVESGHIQPHKIFASNRTPRKLQKLVETLGINECESNEKVVEQSDVVVIAVKPQNIYEALESLRSSFNPQQAVVSLAAGVRLSEIKSLCQDCRVGRLMPNVGTSVKRGVFGFCTDEQDDSLKALVEDLFEPLGLVISLPEGDAFDALTVSCASGPGFIFELMQIWQEWIEQFEIEPAQARAMTLHTFLGTAELALKESNLSFYELQTKVVSKKGTTAAGLESLREREIDSVLRYSFERAAMRARELAKIRK